MSGADELDQAGDAPTSRERVADLLAERQALAETGVRPADTTPVAEAIRARRNRKETL